MSDGTTRKGGGIVQVPADGWKEYKGNAYRCPVEVLQQEERWIARAITLPSVSATGATEREALDNITVEVGAVILRDKGAGQPIPWTAAEKAPPGQIVRWVFIYL